MQDMDDNALNQTLLSYMEKQKVNAIRKEAAANRRFRQRKSWTAFNGNLTYRQFKRYFRMSRECFCDICRRIEENVGESQFKSEQYLRNLKESSDPADKKILQAMKCHADKSTGGFISGEVKLTITLRILAGGSYLDLALLYDTSSSHAYDIFHSVINNSRLNGIRWLEYNRANRARTKANTDHSTTFLSLIAKEEIVAHHLADIACAVCIFGRFAFRFVTVRFVIVCPLSVFQHQEGLSRMI